MTSHPWFARGGIVKGQPGGVQITPAVGSVIPLSSSDQEADPNLSHAGAATEPLAEFDHVAYLNAALRNERADRRHERAQMLMLGAAIGIVAFSVLIGIFS